MPLRVIFTGTPGFAAHILHVAAMASVLAGVVSMPAASAAELIRSAVPQGKRLCRDVCTPEDLLATSKSDLRSAGDRIEVSCGLRLEETPVDGTYMQSCVDRMRTLAAEFSRKWSEDLAPVDPGLIRYDWNRDFGCIDFALGSGRGFGICPVYGVARIPLQGRTLRAPSPQGE